MTLIGQIKQVYDSKDQTYFNEINSSNNESPPEYNINSLISEMMTED
jgi:hypothetical protein